MSEASRDNPPPDHRDPKAKAGLTMRRKERGLPTGMIVHGPYCPHCAMLVPVTATECPWCHRELR